MIALDNLKADLSEGLFAKLYAPKNPNRVDIGNTEIISERDNRDVSCYEGTVVNDYVPFYFSVKTPMLYNIFTGRGVKQANQKNIIYLCIPLLELANNDFQWCFSNGNAAKKITEFYNDLKKLNKIDWHSIESEDFRIDNADGDKDRIRKKHSEFLVKKYVPSDKIKGIAVCSSDIKSSVEEIVNELDMDIKVRVRKTFYF